MHAHAHTHAHTHTHIYKTHVVFVQISICRGFPICHDSDSFELRGLQATRFTLGEANIKAYADKDQ